MNSIEAALAQIKSDVQAHETGELRTRDLCRRLGEGDMATMHGDRARMCREILDMIDARIQALEPDSEAEIDRLRAEIASLKSARQWRPIETADLQNEGGSILGCDGCGTCSTAYRWMGTWVDDRSLEPLDLTHWMPLPAPPEDLKV